MISFIRRLERPLVSTVTEENVASFPSIDDVVFIGYRTPDDEILNDRFHATAKQFQDRYSFGMALIAQPPSAIQCYNNFDGRQHVLKELSTVDSIPNFIRLCSTTLIPKLTRRNELLYLNVSV
jgi:protein disulfide-isomerase A1